MSAATFFGSTRDRIAARFRSRAAASIVPPAGTGGPLLWILAIMVALVVVGAGAMLAIGSVTGATSDRLSGQALVQIVEADASRRAKDTRSIASLLQGSPAIASVRIVPEEELSALLDPWLGDAAEAGVVPVPALIDVEFAGTANADMVERLRERISAINPDARLDLQEEWLAPVLNALASLRYAAVTIVALLSVMGIVAVWLATRNALMTNRKNIEVVHLLGGDDDQITQFFQRAVLADTLIGCVVGYIIGVVLLLFLGSQFAALAGGLPLQTAWNATDWFALLGVPLAAIALVIVTARYTVMASLRRML